MSFIGEFKVHVRDSTTHKVICVLLEVSNVPLELVKELVEQLTLKMVKLGTILPGEVVEIMSPEYPEYSKSTYWRLDPFSQVDIWTPF